MSLSDMSLDDLKNLKDVVDALLDYSGASIIQNNFIESFYKYTINGRLKGTYKLFGAKSFRLTSNSPNMLNLPATGSIYAKAVKQCLVAEEGFIILQADESALEDRVIANLSRDKNKCAVFTHGIDGHCLNAYSYFKEEVEKELPKDSEDTYEYVKKFKQEVENGNKKLKSIRQRSKPVTFGLSYGAYPKKVSKSIGCTLEEAQTIFDRYHNELYTDVTRMRDTVLEICKNTNQVPLGLGAILKTSNPEGEIRTLFNACSQYWSIILLITIHEMNKRIVENNLENDVQIVCSIYDSIYIHVRCDSKIIKWVNDTLIPIMTVPYLKDMEVPNKAESEIGFNWYDAVAISNNASIEEIEEAIHKAKELLHAS